MAGPSTDELRAQARRFSEELHPRNEAMLRERSLRDGYQRYVIVGSNLDGSPVLRRVFR